MSIAGIGLHGPLIHACRFRAVVDWFEIELETPAPTNAWTLKARYGVDYVAPQNKGAGGAATVFRLRFQDPKNYHAVVVALDEIQRKVPLLRTPTISGIELSLDAYLAGATVEQLGCVVAHMYKFQSRPASVNRRIQGFAGTRYTAVGVPPHTQLTTMLGAGRVAFIGNTGADRSQRFYVKTRDAGAPLPEVEHRARMEDTRHGHGLPCHSLDGWRGFEFDKQFSTSFNFRKLKPDLDAATEYTLQHANQVGAKYPRAGRDGRVRQFGRASDADKLLNLRARDALRDLSRRWKSEDWRQQESGGGVASK